MQTLLACGNLTFLSQRETIPSDRVYEYCAISSFRNYVTHLCVRARGGESRRDGERGCTCETVRAESWVWVFNNSWPNFFEEFVNGAGRLERDCLSSVTGERRRKGCAEGEALSPFLSFSRGNIIVF